VTDGPGVSLLPTTAFLPALLRLCIGPGLAAGRSRPAEAQRWAATTVVRPRPGLRLSVLWSLGEITPQKVSLKCFGDCNCFSCLSRAIFR